MILHSDDKSVLFIPDGAHVEAIIPFGNHDYMVYTTTTRFCVDFDEALSVATSLGSHPSYLLVKYGDPERLYLFSSWAAYRINHLGDEASSKIRIGSHLDDRYIPKHVAHELLAYLRGNVDAHLCREEMRSPDGFPTT